MIPTKWNPLKFALGGALIGAGISFVQLKHGWTGEMILFNAGHILGGATVFALLAGVSARIRNAFVGRK